MKSATKKLNALEEFIEFLGRETPMRAVRIDRRAMNPDRDIWVQLSVEDGATLKIAEKVAKYIDGVTSEDFAGYAGSSNKGRYYVRCEKSKSSPVTEAIAPLLPRGSAAYPNGALFVDLRD